MVAPTIQSKSAYLTILFLFLLSGALGLGYQVLWSKYLLDFIGVSAYSYATVLASFMGGLALGSWLLGKFADRAKSPLKVYAYLELGIGAYAIAYVPLAHFVSNLYGNWVSFTPDQSGGTIGLGAKIVSSGLLLLLPTALMGGTYPVLLRHVTHNLGVVGKKASQLYAANSFGAVLGTLLMTFAFLPLLGMQASLMLLAILNAVLAIVSLALSGFRSFLVSTNEAAPGIVSELTATLTPSQVRLALALICIEGFLAFALEIAWTRYFGIVLGSTTYSFSIMLAAFISGIAIGSAWLAKWEHRIDAPLYRFGQTQILVAILVMLPLPLYPYVPWLFEQYSSMLSTRLDAFYLYEFGKLCFCYAIMLLPAIFIGMSLPLMVKGLSMSLASLGKDVGRIYSWNTLGNVLGALFAGIFLLPLLGMENLLYATAITTAILGVVTVFLFVQRQSKISKVPYLAVLVAAIIYQSFSGEWDARWFTLLPFNRTYFSSSFAEAKTFINRSNIVFAKDDAAGHIMVKREPLASGEAYSLFVNGKVDGSSDADMVTQVLLAQVPLLLHQDPQDVLVIGLGTGVTVGSTLTHPVRRADAVEIVKIMPEATKLFTKWNNNPFADPRFHLIHDDARTYVSYTNQKYDVIISEPSNPWMAGVAALYTRDFYERAKLKLKPKGFYLQWLQAYEMSNETLSTIIRTFRSSYPYVYAFQGQFADLLLLGSAEPLHPDWTKVEKRFYRPKVLKDLRRVFVEDLPSLLYLQRFSPASVDLIASHTTWENTDDNHFLEYRAPQDLFMVQKPTLAQDLDERLISAPSLFWKQFARENPQRHLRQTMALIMKEGVVVPEVVKFNQITFCHFFGDTSHASELLVDPPESEASLANHLRVLAQGQFQSANALLTSYAPAILLASALSEEKATFWISELGKWMPARKESAFRAFWIELLMTSDKTDVASAQLLEWVKSATPPNAQWAITRAAQIGSTDLRNELVEIYLRRGSSPFLEKLEGLQRAGGS